MTARWTWMAAAGLIVAAAPATAATVKDGVDAYLRGDYKKAIDVWRPLAIAGDPDAQFNMGQAYKLGRGVPTDLAQAELWYARAAAQGHPGAQDNYGLLLFQNGKKAEALPWLEKSAARDERRSELVLGTMLFNGDGVPKDWVRAYALVTRSSQQGLEQAGQTLAQMDQYISPEQRQQGTAMAADIVTRAKAAPPPALAKGPPPPATGKAPAPVVVAREPTPAPSPRPGQIATTELPPSQASGPATASTVTEAAPPPEPVRHAPPPRRVAAEPAPAPRAPAPRPAMAAPKPAAGGHFRVQLGAFRDEGNARALWSRIGGRVGGAPSYVKAGAVTRLLAGPFATHADAERACHAAGTSCVVVP